MAAVSVSPLVSAINSKSCCCGWWLVAGGQWTLGRDCSQSINNAHWWPVTSGPHHCSSHHHHHHHKGKLRWIFCSLNFQLCTFVEIKMENGQNWTERYKLWSWSLSLTPCQCTAACVSITSLALWCGVFTEAAADELGTAPPLSCVLYDVFVALCHQTSSSRALQCLGRGCFNCDSYSCYLLHKTKLRMGWDR